MLKRHGFDPDVGRGERQQAGWFGYIAFLTRRLLCHRSKLPLPFSKEINFTPKRLLTKVNYFDGDMDIKKKLTEKGAPVLIRE